MKEEFLIINKEEDVEYLRQKLTLYASNTDRKINEIKETIHTLVNLFNNIEYSFIKNNNI